MVGQQELQKELAQLNKEARAFERKAARDRVKIQVQKDVFKSLYKKAKAMGMRVEEFEYDEEEMRNDDEKEKDKNKKEGERKQGGK